jgi:hypothetical protein
LAITPSTTGSSNVSSLSESTNLDENGGDDEENITAAMKKVSFEDSATTFFAFKPQSVGKYLCEYYVKVYYLGDPSLCVYFKASQFLEISTVKQKSTNTLSNGKSSYTAMDTKDLIFISKTYLKATIDIKNKKEACAFIDHYLSNTIDAVEIICAQNLLY